MGAKQPWPSRQSLFWIVILFSYICTLKIFQQFNFWSCLINILSLMPEPCTLTPKRQALHLYQNQFYIQAAHICSCSFQRWAKIFLSSSKCHKSVIQGFFFYLNIYCFHIIVLHIHIKCQLFNEVSYAHLSRIYLTKYTGNTVGKNRNTMKYYYNLK